ncbi:actin-like protein 10 isoform X3 [Peromyscus leucopus]|uniref:actin-like protein 10 isoform X3 n=1 Tax=Peromyscus leucopus TaxID=10041 RepID=UPI0010A13BEB|nr:actin-like protein 10 isoform X3 [Peromyscus leucopus]
MGNSSSHKRTKAPSQASKDSRPPGMEKARHKQFFSHLKRKKPSPTASQHVTFPFFQWREAPDSARVGENPRIKAGKTKIVLLFPLDKRQQLAEAAAGPYVRPGRPAEDALGAPTCFPAVAPMLRGAGDGVDRREGARAREMKRILVLLLQLDARLQEEGRRGAGGRGGGAKAPQGWQPLYAHLLTHREACGEGDPREEQPRKRRRCPRPRP